MRRLIPIILVGFASCLYAGENALFYPNTLKTPYLWAYQHPVIVLPARGDSPTSVKDWSRKGDPTISGTIGYDGKSLQFSSPSNRLQYSRASNFGYPTSFSGGATVRMWVVSFWIKTSTVQAFTGVIDQWASNAGFMVDLSSGGNLGKPRLSVNARTGITINKAVNDGQWHHVVFKHGSDTKYTTMIDGVIYDNEVSDGTDTNFSTSQPHNMYVPADGASTLMDTMSIDNFTFFNGWIRNAQAYHIYGREKQESR